MQLASADNSWKAAAENGGTYGALGNAKGGQDEVRLSASRRPATNG